MNTLAMEFEPFDYELDLNDVIHKPSSECSCVQCQKNKASDSINQSLQELLESENLYDNEFEDEINFVPDSELELEQERKRRFRHRPNRSKRRTTTRIRKTPRRKPRPQHPDKVLRSKFRPRRKKFGKRPVLRSRRRRPFVIHEPAAPCVCPAHGTEFVHWVQSSLNQVLKLRLRINGVMNRATRNALRDFQKQEGLPIDGIAGPETERALVLSKNPIASKQGEGELSYMAIHDDYPYRELEEEFSFSDFPKAILKVLHKGLEKVAVTLAVRFGTRNENKLTDLIFFGRHQERGGRFLKKRERNFKSLRFEWVSIRNLLVRPIVARSFFAEYELRFKPGKCTFCIDSNTNMNPSQKKNRTNDVGAILRILLDHRNKRASAALKRRQTRMTPLPSLLQSIVRRLSDTQLELFKEFFPNNSGGINFNAFQFAFELFSNGELRDSRRKDGFGEPDGGHYFLFAEFAFLCINSKIDKTLWSKALKAFVKTQEIFIHIYRPPPHTVPPSVGKRLPKLGSAKNKLSDFKFSNFNSVGQSDEKRKKKLRAKYDHRSVSALRRSARDNLLRAQRMP